MNQYKVMASNQVLKWYLEKSIDDLIESLKRRVLINTNTPNPILLTKKRRRSTPKEQLRAVQAAYHRHKDVERIILECHETISKLQLLRMALSYTDIYILLHLFANYTLYSYEDILSTIFPEQATTELSAEVNYIMVA